MFRLLSVLAIAAGALLSTATTASADTFGFSCITSNDPTDCGILEAQLRMDVTAVGTNRVQFRFTNTGPEDSSIADVYFDDLLPPMLGTPVTISSSAGVAFSSGCAPGNLPGGNPYGFTTSYCADSDSPVQPNGVNPGEYLEITYTLQGTSSFANVIASLNSGDYVVGIHVQGFDNGGSVAGISHSVPEPGSLLLLTTAIGVFPFIRRRPVAAKS